MKAMISFKEFLEEKRRGRKPLDPNYEKNAEFVKKNYKDYSSLPAKVAHTKEKFLKAIEQHDKELLKDLKDDSLETLHSIIVKHNIDISSKRKRDWEAAEKSIVAGFNQLVADGVFVATREDGKEVPVDKTMFRAMSAGGGRQSDIKVQNLSNPKANFFIESKLDFLAAEYFKYGLKIEGKKMIYDHRYFIEGDFTAEEKKFIDELFSKKINLSGFLNQLLNSKELQTFWNKFLQRLDEVESTVKEDKDFGQFAGKLHFNGSFPHDTDALVELFNLYCKHYIEKYNSLVDQIFDTYEGNFQMDVDEYYIMDHTKDEEYDGVFWTVNYMMSLFYSWNEVRQEFEGEEPLDIDEKKMDALSDELKTIEVKLDRIMKSAKITNPCDLYKLTNADKLKFFFKAFLSSVGRKQKDGSIPLIGNDLEKDQLGNMQICPEVVLENGNLAQMITDFYVQKDKCPYLQIGNVIYLLDENFNVLQLPDLPIFKQCITKFTVKLLVKDDMSSIRLSVKAIEPEKSVFQGCNLLSFKAQDPNFIGKKMKNIAIELN